MKLQRLAILAFAAFVTIAVHGQLFHPLGLGIETPREMAGDIWPQTHVEGNILYVCTKQGLYSKDLSDGESAWQLAGFEGIPLQDYARRGDDLLAVRFDYNGSYLLLSHDGGQTYEDITPDMFKGKKHGFILNLDCHPTDPNTLLVSSWYDGGIYLTTDFGQTWNKLSPYTPIHVGFHPLNPEIIYEVGGAIRDMETDLHISYDGGQTWQKKWSCFPNYLGIYRMAFHPTDPNKWIAGGNHCVHTTSDNGQTWNTQVFRDYNETVINWHYAAYDNENADIVYMAGDSHNEYMKLMCSTDGGTTWNRPYLEQIKTTPTEIVFDMKQYGDKLLVYSQSDVYEISKAELLAQGQGATSVQCVALTTTGSGTLYDLCGRKMVTGKLPRGIYIENGKKKVK